MPFVAAISLDAQAPGLCQIEGDSWIYLQSDGRIDPGACVLSAGLAYFNGVTAAGYLHETIIAGGQPKDLPEFQWVNTVLGNLKTSLSGAYHVCKFGKYASTACPL